MIPFAQARQVESSRPNRRSSRTLIAILAFSFTLSMLHAQETSKLGVMTAEIGAPYVDLTETDLDGDGRKDLLVSLAESPPRWRVLLQLPDRSGFASAIDVPVPEGISAIVIADVDRAPGSDIVLLSSTGVALLTGLLTKAERGVLPIAKLELLFPKVGHVIPRHWDWGRDLDGDGREDLLLPGLDDDLLLPGVEAAPYFGAPVRIAMPGTGRLTRSGGGLVESVRRRPRVGFARVRPGASPHPILLMPEGLAFIERGETGHFDSAPDVLFPNPAPVAGGLSLLRRLDLDLADLDADGLEDLVFTRTTASGRPLPKLRTDLVFHQNGRSKPRKATGLLLLPGVLSSGPDIADVDGDGLPDLFVSTFAGGASQQIERLFGQIKLEYHLYLGTGESMPFPRAPVTSLVDRVPTEDFEIWGRRHRRLLGDDWNDDGRQDLVRIDRDDDRITVRIHAGLGRGKSFRFADAALAESSLKRDAQSYGLVRLSKEGPAVRLKSRVRVDYLAIR